MIRKNFISIILCLSLLVAVCPAADAAGTVTGADAVAAAQNLVGKYPYVSGGRSPSNRGFDCSGLIYYVYHTCLGCNVTYEQIWSRSVPGTKITNKSSLLPGDIIFGRNNSGGWHTGLYCGNNIMIHAGSSKGVSRTSINGTWFTFKFATRPAFITTNSNGTTSPPPVAPIGKTSKPSVSVNGQSVTISWDYSGGASKFDVYLVQAPWRWEDITCSFSTTSKTCTFTNIAPGDYRAFVIARPNADTEQSEWVNVEVKAEDSRPLPSNFTVSTDKSTYSTNESMIITPSASNATHYAISIWRGAFETGERVYADFSIYGPTAFTPTDAGNYTIRADAINNAGYISTEKTFTVTAPAASDTSKNGYWGPWSEWTSNYVEATPTRHDESRSVKLSDGHTEYRYGRFVDSTGTKVCWCKTYLESWKSVSGSASLQYSDWSATRYNENGKIWGCGFCGGEHMGVNYISEDGRAWWSQFELPGGYYYWEETRTIEPSYGTEYCYRDWISG